MLRQRSESIASLEYYRTHDSTLQMSAREELQNPVMNSVSPDRHTQQSRRLPFWLWFIIAKSLGIKLHQDDRPIVATILYTFTFMSALGFFLSKWWFTAYDIVSDYTKTTVIDGTVTIIYTVLWGAMGVYANKLAFKLFSHKKFLDMLRLHSKTILKMNASVVIFVLMLLIAIFSNLNSFEDFEDRTCKTVSVEVLVCKVNYVFRVMYSGFSVIWNSLVAFVVISSCRTHVIGIRRFMQALEQDARVYESRYVGMAQQINANRPVLEEYTWVDEDYLDDLRDPGVIDIDAASSIFIPHQSVSTIDEADMSASSAPINTASPTTTAGPATTTTTTAATATTVRSEVPVTRQREVSAPSSNYGSVMSSPSDHSFHASSSVSPEREHSTKRSSVCNSLPQVRPLMSNSEILFRYWKIQSRLRMTSVALQRWMMSVICLVVIWLAMNLVQWLSFNPSLIDLINFFLPLVLLPLLSSAYAEVNQEGQRLLKFICPIEERLQLLFVLQNAPLQMTVYGFSLTYSTITTAAFGILLAFASKVLLQEMSGGGGPKT